MGNEITTLSAATNPIRYPDSGLPTVMTRRAWWLVAFNFLIPGSAQSLAGSRKLGRFGLLTTLSLWLSMIAIVTTYAISPTLIYTITTQTITLWVGAVILSFYAVLWVVLTIDTLRIVRLVRTQKSARPKIVLLATILMFSVSGTATYGTFLASTASGFLSSVFVAGPSTPPIDGRYNILLLGGDAGPDRSGMRPDSISVVSIDADTGAVTIIGLPRDMEDVPFTASSPLASKYPEGYGAINGCEVYPCKLNSIYTEVELKTPELYPNAEKHGSTPGMEGMRDAASGILGIPIQNVVLIDMQSFSTLIDALGGVNINVETRVPVGGDENLVGVAEWIEPGMQNLNGYYAMWYARSRHGDDDYARMARQRQIQEAILEQANPVNVLSNFQAVAASGSRLVKTDIAQSMLGYFVNLASKSRTQPISRIEITPANGFDPDDPDFAAIHSSVQDLLWPPTPKKDS